MSNDAVQNTTHQRANVRGIHNVIIQNTGDGVTIVTSDPWLVLEQPSARVRHGTGQVSEAELLTPYRRSIELVGRDDDLAYLRNWMGAKQSISVRTITGRAGAGKTRIAIELHDEFCGNTGHGWEGGFVRGEELSRFMGQSSAARWGWRKPTLIIVDYAAAVSEHLRAFLIRLAGLEPHPDRPTLRILLLEREASHESGWLQSLQRSGQSDAAIRDFFDDPQPHPLMAISRLEDRHQVLSRMLEVGAAEMKLPPTKLPTLGDDPRVDKQLENRIWNDPLYLMMASLVALRSDVLVALSCARRELARKVAEHELSRIEHFAPMNGNVPDAAARALLRHMAAFATMCGGLTSEQVMDAAEQEAHELRLAYPGGSGALGHVLKRALPDRPGDGGVGAILPDILGEAVVLDAMQLNELGGDAELKTVRRALDRNRRRVAAFLIRAAQDFAAEDSTNATADGKADVRALGWLEAVADVAVKTVDLQMLFQLETQMPLQTTVLRRKALEVTETLVRILDDSSTQGMAERARLLNNLAIRLSDQGRRDQALKVAQEAVRILGQLVKSDPDTFLPKLAMSLNNLANRLSDMGRREEALKAAQEAVRISEQLTRSNPDAFLPNLAGSQDTLANRLSDLGRREEALKAAQEAERIHEQLSKSNPDAFLPKLAMSLNTVGNRSSELGRREEALKAAQKAVRIYEQLAKSNPDSFLPERAMSLNNLANRLSELGRREEALTEAQKAVRIYGQLTKSDPDAFLPNLAASLNTVANRSNELGRREEALEAAREAVRIREQLAKSNPDAFLPDMAMSLSDLSRFLSKLGRPEEALKAAQQAVRIIRQLAKSNPDTFLPNLAGALNNLGMVLNELGRREEALNAAQEAMQTYEQLAKSNPGVFLPNLAGSLNNLGVFLGALGHQEEAMDSAQKAVRIYEQLSKSNPDVFLPDLAMALASLGRCHEGAGRHVEAAEAFGRGIVSVTEKFRQVPAAFGPLMSALCQDYVSAVEATGQEPDMVLLEPLIEVFEMMQGEQKAE